VIAQQGADRFGAQDPEALSGLWEFQVARPGDSPVAVTHGRISWTGSEFVVTDLQRGTESVARLAEGRLLRLPLSASFGPSSQNYTSFVAELRPAAAGFDAPVLTAEASVAGDRFAFSMVRLPAIWACDHQDPTHTARTTQEMEELTKDKQCKGWHQITH
jgi:hypothetical protein